MNDKPLRETTYGGLAVALGMLTGAIAGFAIWIATQTFVFLPVFIGCGLTVGLAAAEGLKERAANHPEGDPRHAPHTEEAP